MRATSGHSKVFNTWRIAPASAGTVSHWASLKVSAGVLSGARGYVCHEALWWVHCQSDGRWFSSKTLPYLLLSRITSGTYCHTLDSSEADAKVKSGAHGVSQGSSPVSRRGYEQDWTEGFAELWVSPNKAPVNLVMTQGIAHSRWAAVAGPLCLCLAQYTPAIRWRRSARDADRFWRSRQLETAASTVHRGQQVLPWRVVWVTRRCVWQSTQWFCWFSFPFLVLSSMHVLSHQFLCFLNFWFLLFLLSVFNHITLFPFLL